MVSENKPATYISGSHAIQLLFLVANIFCSICNIYNHVSTTHDKKNKNNNKNASFSTSEVCSRSKKSLYDLLQNYS